MRITVRFVVRNRILIAAKNLTLPRCILHACVLTWRRSILIIIGNYQRPGGTDRGGGDAPTARLLGAAHLVDNLFLPTSSQAKLRCVAERFIAMPSRCLPGTSDIPDVFRRRTHARALIEADPLFRALTRWSRTLLARGRNMLHSGSFLSPEVSTSSR